MDGRGKKPSQMMPYLRVLQAIPLGRLVAVIAGAYLGLVLLAAPLYQVVGFEKDGKPAHKFVDALYFSFVTQSTLGYGDFTPLPQGRWLVVLQTTLGMLVFATGTGAIVFKLVTPPTNAIDFDRHLVFYPALAQFRIRLRNRLSIPLHMAHLEVRLRRRRKSEVGSKWSRKAVALTRDLITVAEPLHPMLVSLKDCPLVSVIDQVARGEEVLLHPSHISPEAEVHVTTVASHFAGTAIAAHRWTAEDITCGRFVSVPVDGTLEWTNWNQVRRTEPSVCDDCRFSSTCLLKDRLVS